ncbi:hypothetical protein SELMODRAFT_79872 [Selaginella moellendorffii]|uniref:DNA/RNA-binding protein Kin17 WH-like domain-containing protein n=1 Tax=Selaginella moellendorffii TaxID=88036 RepID=D8QWM7_SELML|nr:KIN17-like protein [Selaginella moellendorffii]XP_024535314.1 KIN17-like protein [Selaginella moellendorffii]EFJ35263.1 hypothetical protein SELMODRAFT_79872 [Selaginella moellendorffii]|eukprot:XP_002963392.1 KIN17-like protein [Selaginella moellendorffii]
MGKHEFMTPKAIANRIKAKGLQKLRWYCQMCEKQCRDENGFKCHCLSESHQRQMQIFGMSPGKFVGQFSHDFESAFMEHMKRNHRSSRVAANVVYNAYIQDRTHVHMNSSRWATLTDFVKYLGRTGKCKVEDTPKGWFLTYIDREPETLLREGQKQKRIAAEAAGEDRHEREIVSMIKKAKKSSQHQPEAGSSQQATEIDKEVEAGEKIAFSFGGASKPPVAKPASIERHEEHKSEEKNPVLAADTPPPKSKGMGALDELMKEQELVKERKNRKDYWLSEGLVVKVMAKSLADYYKRKGVVRQVINKYVGEIEMLDSGHVLKVDQAELETVIPQIGGLVKIVNGAYRDSLAKLVSIDEDNFCANVHIEKGSYIGRLVPGIAYEDLCKVHA